MLNKFIAIKNVGRFYDYNYCGDMALRKFNLIFAENGLGKTTLCAIMRSLQTMSYVPIAGRKTLGYSGDPSVKILIDGEAISFENNKWTPHNLDIAIFDSSFINDNVYLGDYVEHENKKNLYRIIVGKEGVNLAKKIDELDNKIRVEANKKISDKKDNLVNICPKGVNIEDYIDKWKPIQDIDKKIEQKKAEIDKIDIVFKRASEIKNKELMSKITLPCLPDDYLEILSEKLSDILLDAEASVKEQITKHHMESHGETWISQGLSFIENNKCPFCEQDIDGIDLIAMYRSHFNDNYKKLKEKVTRLNDRTNNAIGTTKLGSINKIYLLNKSLIEFWKQFMEISIPNLDIDDIEGKYLKLLELSLVLVNKKIQSPTEEIDINPEFRLALNAVSNLQEGVKTYNNAIDSSNILINKQKELSQKAQNINEIKKEFDNLINYKKRFEQETINKCNEYNHAKNEKKKLEQEKEKTKKELDDYCENVFEVHEKSINSYLEKFNAGFKVKNVAYSYKGGTPSSSYQIQINNISVDLGDSKTKADTPCFRNTLSSGDRSALALAFFFSSIGKDKNLDNKIIILDDPFTSLDRFRRTRTKELICQLTDKAKQVIVLSHDAYFLKLLSESFHPGDTKVLKLCREQNNINNTAIEECCIESEIRSNYYKNFDILLEFYKNNIGKPIDVVRAIRPLLEEWLRMRFPGFFKDGEWLGDFIKKSQDYSNSTVSQLIKKDLSEIININDYSKVFHHGNNQVSNPDISDNELRGYVQKTLGLLGVD